MADPAWRLLADGLQFPEGPAFASDGALWCVEYKGGRLVRLSGGTLERFDVGGAPNGIAIDPGGLIWFCDAGQRAIRTFDGSVCQTVCAEIGGQPLDKPNDLCFDPAGNLLFTCPGDSRTEPLGYVCCLARGGPAHKIAEGLYFPNGLALSRRGRLLTVAETYRHRLWRGAWDHASRKWLDAAPWAHAGGPVGPDGMAFNASGHLHVAVYGQRAVKVFDDHGALLRVIETPGRNPTNVAFDPAGPLGLVVTEAEQGCLWSLPNP